MTASKAAKMEALRREIAELEEKRDSLLQGREKTGDDVDQSTLIQFYNVVNRLMEVHGQLERMKNQMDDVEDVILREGAITTGSFVRLMMAFDDGETEEMIGKIVPISNGNDHEISDDSPVGKAILGKCQGETAACVLPGGAQATLTILSVK